MTWPPAGQRAGHSQRALRARGPYLAGGRPQAGEDLAAVHALLEEVAAADLEATGGCGWLGPAPPRPAAREPVSMPGVSTVPGGAGNPGRDGRGPHPASLTARARRGRLRA